MTTVADVNQAFEQKKMSIKLPYPDDWQVKNIQILEKKDTAAEVKVLLALELIYEGKVINDMCFLEGEIIREQPKAAAHVDAPQKNSHLLPTRDRFDFENDEEVLAYLKEAFESLLLDNDYKIEEHEDSDIYGIVGKRGFFLMLAPRLDAGANSIAQHLVDLRKKYKHMNDYGLVVPAFQEPLGISLSAQESWVMANVDKLSSHRIGVYGVDNSDPNRIYPFTIYPQVRGLLRYFVAASRQWQDARMQYLSIRG